MKIDYSNYKVLVVDDIPTNVLLLKVILEQEKFGVVTAHSGIEALKILEKEKIDLLLLDVMMPDMTGIQVAEKIKETESIPNTPIIFITALNSTEEIVKGFNVGANDYISKPFNKDELITRVKHQISLIHAKRTILQQRDELKSLVQARDRLYSVIAHDLRSPISSLKMVLNALSLTAKDKNVDPQFIEMLDAGCEISEQVFCLLDNLLKWAKAQSGILKPIFQPFNLYEIVSSLVDVANPSAKLKKIELSMDLATDVLVSVDIDIMKSIIRNLIFNAIKFSYPDTTIQVILKKINHEAVLEVVDQGIGINPENQDKIRNKISGFTTYGTKNEEGTGLGILLASHFVDLHKGRFFFHSEEGKGSSFGFSIPLLDTST